LGFGGFRAQPGGVFALPREGVAMTAGEIRFRGTPETQSRRSGYGGFVAAEICWSGGVETAGEAATGEERWGACKLDELRLAGSLTVR